MIYMILLLYLGILSKITCSRANYNDTVPEYLLGPPTLIPERALCTNAVQPWDSSQDKPLILRRRCTAILVKWLITDWLTYRLTYQIPPQSRNNFRDYPPHTWGGTVHQCGAAPGIAPRTNPSYLRRRCTAILVKGLITDWLTSI
jgi:hypothetical protein